MTNGNSDRQIERIATKDGPLLGVCFYRWAKVSCKGTYYGDAIDVEWSARLSVGRWGC